MIRYRNVFVSIWDDARFRALPNMGKLLWFHAYTNTHTNAIGLYKMPLAGMAAEIKWPIETYLDTLEQCLKEGLMEVDSDLHLVCFPKFFKWNTPDNPNVLISWIKHFHEIPDCELKTKHIQSLINHSVQWDQDSKSDKQGFLKVCERFFGTYAVTIPKQEQEQEQEKEQDKRASAAKPPEEDGVPNCPYGKLVELYHELIPQQPRIRKIDDKLKRMLQARWREEPERQSLDWWRKFFTYIATKNPFLIGAATSHPDRKPFSQGLRFYVRTEEILLKIQEGHYEHEQPQE